MADKKVFDLGNRHWVAIKAVSRSNEGKTCFKFIAKERPQFIAMFSCLFDPSQNTVSVTNEYMKEHCCTATGNFYSKLGAIIVKDKNGYEFGRIGRNSITATSLGRHLPVCYQLEYVW